MQDKVVLRLIASVMLIGFFGQCSDKGTNGKDHNPPSTIADLAVETVTDSSVTLSWTAPGDDQTTGTVAFYDLRYASIDLTTAVWDSAIQVLDEPAPQAAGAAEQFTVGALEPSSTYWFALKTADESDNWSALSNVVQGTTQAMPSTTWLKTYGTVESDGAKCVMATGDEGFVVAGWTRDTDTREEDFYLLKTSPSGEKIWENQFGGSKVDYAWSVLAADGGGFVTAGLTYSLGAGRSDVYVVYTDVLGQPTNDYTFGGSDSEEAFALIPSGDGGFVLAGYTKSSGAGLQDVHVLKVDVSGLEIWQKQYGGANNDAAHAVCPMDDGGFIVVGETQSFGAGGRDVYLLRLTATGDSLWSRTYGGMQDDLAYAVLVEAGGGFVVAGATESSGAGDFDVLLLKCDADGDSVWAAVVGGAGIDYAFSLVEAADGGYVLAGFTSSFGAGGDDAYLLKLDLSGQVQWEKTYGGQWDDRASWVAPTSDNGYIITGWTKSSGMGSADVLLIKTDADGEY